MEKAQIIEGYEKLQRKLSYTKALIKKEEFVKAINNAKDVIEDSKYFLRHLGALINARKRIKKKSKVLINGLSKVKRRAKTKIKGNNKLLQSNKATKKGKPKIKTVRIKR